LTARFNYACCDTLDQFRREPQAVTRAGQTKGRGERHEKDDRHRIDDRSRYVLGWSNEQKIEALLRDRRNLEEALHLANDKTLGLHRALSVREMSPKRIVKMKHQFYATVGQDSFPRRITDRSITFQRPNAFYKRCEGRMNRIFAIAGVAHCAIDLIAFARLNSSDDVAYPTNRAALV